MARNFDGRRLRQCRLDAGWSRELLALTVERSYYSVCEYELGRVVPPAAVIARLADALDLSIDALFDDLTAAA